MMSLSKYASNVVEKCLVHGNPGDQIKIISEILELESKDILKLMRDT